MAIRLIDQYPNRANPATPDYPHGSVRNESSPNANDGTPLEQAWANDIAGFLQALLEEGGVTPNGVPDTALASQYLDALRKIMLPRSEVGDGPLQVPTNQLLGHVRPEGFGAVGDGATDDAAALTAAFAAAAGGEIHLTPGKTYVSSTAQVLPEATTLHLNGATIKFTPDGEVKCLELRSRTRVLNGAIDCTGTNITGEDNYDMHCPILIGDYEGGAGYSDIVIDGVTITSNRENGNGILVTGDSHNIVLRNLRFPDSATMGRPIALHWGGRNGGAPVVTTHPHDTVIENIAIGKMTNNGTNASGISLSAAYNVQVRNVQIEEALIGIDALAGDYGNTYASADEERFVGSNTLIENVSVLRARQYGLRIYGKSYIAQNLLPLPVVVRNFQASGNQASPAGVGILIQHGVRPVIEQAWLEWFEHGVWLGQETTSPALRGVLTNMTRRSGIVVDGGSGAPVSNALIENCYVTDFNKAESTSGDDRAGILVRKARLVSLVGNRLGRVVDETGHYGVRITSDAVYTKLSRNHVYGIGSGGVAYSISGYSSVTLGDSNTREGSISLFDGVSVKQIIGGGYVWVDPTGKLRIDTNLPTSETSGAVVGTQT